MEMPACAGRGDFYAVEKTEHWERGCITRVFIFLFTRGLGNPQIGLEILHNKNNILQ